ncbi:MAG TPA: MaoC family dehydratase [Candidatus Thermoplasmatota archaeon]|nr:MaoC family dehydratase [Candidatus Thermoplasmatota archaeon]
MTHASTNPALAWTSTVVAAQSAALRAASDHWLRSTRYLLGLAPTGTSAAPEVRGDPAETPGHGPAAEKAQGSIADVAVGYRLEFTRRVTTDLIEAFGDVSGDVARLHFDEDYAAKSRFGGRIAHGMLTGAFISAALSRLPGLVIYLSQELRFIGPARPGDVITARITVTERPEGKSWARLRTECLLEDGTVIADGEAKVLLGPEP